MNWRFDETMEAEQYNTLVMLDTAFAKMPVAIHPVFHVLGGTALVFHGCLAVATVDIDVANKLSPKVKEMVEPFVSDEASYVATLPKNYVERLVPYCPGDFNNIEVFLLSLEDLVITKLGAWRSKDKDDIGKTDLLKRANLDKVYEILKSEFDENSRIRLMQRLASF